jgi:hypothetical protein
MSFRLRAPGGRTALLALVPALLTPATLRGQTRPLQTETAETAASGTLVFETGFDLIAGEPSYLTRVERTRWEGPLLRLTYSPGDNVELDAEWVAAVGVIGELGRGDVPSWDWGDVALRAKWRFVRGGRRRPVVAARFGVYLPETSFEDRQHRPLGLAPNTLRAFAEALVAQPLGEGRLLLNAGMLVADEVYHAHEQQDFFCYGVALEWPVGRRATAVGEVAGRTGHGAPGTEVRSEARVGLRWGEGRLRADFAVRRGIATADGTWGLTVGLGWTVRPR